ncbi:POTRA domain-containing protein [Alkalinema sp. FACHB-956]|uniref:ShlB/FhaC/HecB family hemolysin secretion/activation protein n=1 Tax=Alkalinema sp. FACHB-956 TaxID=2692768 RepID=UPI0016841245|nr:POTRA domain-containing protein [Alkalinema sp. FACHB-956]MBD2326186.1 ShlB/FhaC/HecB family hemolysin secretion/activation protein [Alkalinema sp. FACHB-956]
MQRTLGGFGLFLTIGGLAHPCLATVDRTSVDRTTIDRMTIDAQSPVALPPIASITAPLSLPLRNQSPLLASSQLHPSASDVSSGPSEGSPTVYVQQFEVKGSTVFRPWELANVTQPYEDQTLKLEDLQKAADAVTRYYLDHGYLTSRAVLADQTIENGKVAIQVIEGRLEKIEITGSQRINPQYLRKRIERAGLLPLNQEALENHLRLLRADPLVENIEASLKEGSSVGNSILSIRIKEAPSTFGQFTVSNHNAPAVGRTSLGFVAGSRNLSGIGDLVIASFDRSTTGGSALANLIYQYPLNSKQGTLLVRFSPNQFRLTDPEFKELDITGSSHLAEITLRQPIVRIPSEEVALSLGVIHRRGKTLVADILSSESQTKMLRFGQEVVKRDFQGFWRLNSQFNLGNTQTESASEATSFLTWSGQFQRQLVLGKNHALLAELSWQLASTELHPSQRFSAGGATTLRGYPVNFFNTDNGVTFSLSEQWVFKRNAKGRSVLTASPFLDLGVTWNHSGVMSQDAKGLISSAGIGLLWQPTEKISFQVDVALPLRSIGSVRSFSPAFYFNSSYEF